MIKEDFSKLHIFQEIYFKGILRKISSLALVGEHDKPRLYFYDEVIGYWFIDIMADLSFEPPKPKRKYYEWLIQETKESNPFVEGDILDDNGRHPNGIEYETKLAKWGRLYFKQKIEDRCWEF